jgi:hypothetical protein
MRLAGMVAALPLIVAATDAPTPVPAMLDETFTNEELVYFEKEAGRSPPEWMAVRVRGAGKRAAVERIDAFGKPVSALKLTIDGVNPDGINVRTSDGRLIALRRARAVKCWAAIPKANPKADGSTDWHFVRDLALHDQGGRVAAGGGDTGTKPLILRMRNVVWAQGPNRPSLVLYVHTPDDTERAASYSWADPEAKRIGINLRWMQASCTINEPQGGSKP